MMSARKKENTNEEQARYHAWFHHQNADGFIAIAKKEGKQFRQYHYKPEELADKLAEWLGEDVYFSQNTFYKPRRKIENIRQLRSLYIDIDCHKMGYDPRWVAEKIKLELYGEKIPVPSLIIFSGRGLIAIWFIEPVPHMALPLWQAIQNHLCNELKYVGGDPNAIDAARIFRAAGSINSKNKAIVEVEYISDYRYELRQIQEDYLPELKPKQEKKKGRQKTVVRMFNTYSLHYSRMLDIVKLVELRSGNIDKREVTLFLYRYWSCCFLSDPDQALEHTLEFNCEFKKPLPNYEVIHSTKSAEKAWKQKKDEEANKMAKSLGFPGAGYNLKNETIIRWLEITDDEQKQLRTIIGKKEKQRRDTEAHRVVRREQGVISRQEYNRSRTESKEHLRARVIELLQEGKKQKEIVEILGVSKGYVSRLAKA